MTAIGRSRLALLTRHFLRRFLDNDLIAPGGDMYVGFSHVLAAFMLPGLMVVMTVTLEYSQFVLAWNQVVHRTFEDAVVYVAMATILFGLAAALTWDAFYLDARDQQALGSLPVSPRLLAMAKLSALGVFLVTLTLAANLMLVLLTPALTLRPVRRSTVDQLMGLTMGTAGASVGAGVFATLAVVALRGVLGRVLPRGLLRRIGPLVQGGLVLGLLGWFVSLPQFVTAAGSVWRTGGWWRDAVPPFWFVGIHRYAVDPADPAAAPMARLALAALLAATVAVVVLYLAWPGRGQVTGATSAAVPTGPLSAGWRLLRHGCGRAFARRPLVRGIFDFLLVTLGRCGVHRLYLAAALGAGLAWSASGVFWTVARSGVAGLSTPTPTALQVQLILTLVMLAAVRFSVTVPATLPANWLFRVTERHPPSCYHRGTRRAVLMVGLLPVIGLAPVHLSLWGWWISASHTLVGALFALILVEVFFRTHAKIPFAAPYVSGAIRLKTRWLPYLLAGSALTALPAFLEHALIGWGGRWVWMLPAFLLMLLLGLVHARRRQERCQVGLVFDEPPIDSVQTLAIFQ